jgi:hypothetical protein
MKYSTTFKKEEYVINACKEYNFYDIYILNKKPD